MISDVGSLISSSLYAPVSFPIVWVVISAAAWYPGRLHYLYTDITINLCKVAELLTYPFVYRLWFQDISSLGVELLLEELCPNARGLPSLLEHTSDILWLSESCHLFVKDPHVQSLTLENRSQCSLFASTRRCRYPSFSPPCSSLFQRRLASPHLSCGRASTHIPMQVQEDAEGMLLTANLWWTLSLPR